jgi:hypothetical protein
VRRKNTVFAHKTMSDALSHAAPGRGVSQIGVLGRDAGGLGLVVYEALKRVEGPAVGPGARAAQRPVRALIARLG